MVSQREYHSRLLCLLCLQVVHDFEHGGLTNDFLVNSLDVLAVRYNDRSPLENHHLAAAFTLMRKPEYEFVCNMPKSDFDKLRKVRVCGYCRGWFGTWYVAVSRMARTFVSSEGLSDPLQRWLANPQHFAWGLAGCELRSAWCVR